MDQSRFDRYPIRKRMIARAAPFVAGLAFVGTAAPEAALAHPTRASVEGTAEYNAQSPQAFIASTDGQLIKFTSAIESAPHVKVVDGPPVKEFSETPVKTKVYYVMAPNADNPKHHNALSVVMAKGQKLPVDMVINLDIEANPSGVIKKAPGVRYYIDHLGDNGAFSPNTINLFVDAPGNTTNYRVGVKKSRFPTSNEFLSDPIGVTKEFSSVFKIADQIIRSS